MKPWTHFLIPIFAAAVVLASLTSGVLLAQTISDPDLVLETVTGGLSRPTTMAFVAPDDILVLQKDNGQVRRVLNGTLQAQPVLDVHVNFDSERGLLGIAVNTETPPKVFLYYTEDATGDTTSGTPLGNRVYRYDWNPGTGVLENGQMILDLPVTNGPNHDGGILLLGPPNEGSGLPGDGALLYAIIGDLNRNGQLQNFPNGDPPDDSGVILRVLQDGTAAPGNPFAPYCSATTAQTCADDTECLGSESCVTEVTSYFAYGVRNSFGMGFDPVTGNLWDTENGPSVNDEVNLAQPGFNSGWEEVMGLAGSSDPPGLFDMPGAGNTYSEPEFTWIDTNAPTAILFPFGSALGPDYDDVALVADNNPGQIYRFPLNGARTAFDFSAFPDLQDLEADTNTERDLLSIGSGFSAVTDLKVGPDSAVYVVSIGQGTIYRITNPDVPTANAGLDRSIAPNNQSIALGGMPAAVGGTEPYSYSWAVSPGTAGVDYTLVSSSDPNPVFTGFTEQSYTATLTVTDDDALQDSDAAVITVEVPEQRDLFNLNLNAAETFEACSTLTADLVVIKAGADVTFIAPAVELGDGFTVDEGATFTVINATPASCV